MKSTDVVQIYNNDYFTKQVDGFKEFKDFNGKFETLFSRYQRNIKLLQLKPEHNFLEFGCGRGEICIFHVMQGGKAKGIDFSQDAIELAKKKAEFLGIHKKVTFIVSSFMDLKDHENLYDRILASEFIEHISKDEGEEFFKLAYRLLKSGGKLLVFTHPNTLYRRYGYPIVRIVNLLRGRRLPRVMDDTTSEHYRLYHLNEQNYFSLIGLVRQAGFTKFTVGYDEEIVDQKIHPLKRFLKLIIASTPLRHLFLCNLFVLAEK